MTVTARSRDGLTASVSVTYTVARPPVLTGLRASPDAFRAATGGGPIGRGTDVGVQLSYRDTLAAQTTLSVYRVSRRGQHGALVRVGSVTRRDRAGANSFRFSGRLGGRSLTPGSYVLRLTATLTGLTSRPLAVTVQVLRPPPRCQDPDRDNDCDAPGQV
jgi:hypothetical protein